MATITHAALLSTSPSRLPHRVLPDLRDYKAIGEEAHAKAQTLALSLALRAGLALRLHPRQCHFSVSSSISSGSRHAFPGTHSGPSGDAVFVAGAPRRRPMDRSACQFARQPSRVPWIWPLDFAPWVAVILRAPTPADAGWLQDGTVDRVDERSRHPNQQAESAVNERGSARPSPSLAGPFFCVIDGASKL